MAKLPSFCKDGGSHNDAVRGIVSSINGAPFRIIVQPVCVECRRVISLTPMTYQLQLATWTVWAERPVARLSANFWQRVRREVGEGPDEQGSSIHSS